MSRQMLQQLPGLFRGVVRSAGLVPLASLLTVLACGCVTTAPVVENPIHVPFDDFEYVWQQTVEVVDKYFEIASENRVEGRIETHPLEGATLLEPWRGDSVELRDQLEATLQSIRRRAFVTVSATDEGYAIQVEVHKELEDLPQPAHPKAGEAVFRSDVSLARQHKVVGPVTAPQGWIHKGRDWNLESRILADLQARFGLR